MKIGFPAKLAPVFEPHRFKSIRGGRDGGKSWSVGRALLEIGAADKSQLEAWGLWCGCEELIVCARENMNTIGDSVHRLLETQIDALDMRDQYGVEKSLIWNRRTKAEFVFKGLHRNPEAVKSLEGATRLWIEEAQGLSDESWRQVIPTLRRPNSEIWATWNPRLETDPTYKRLVLDPPPGLLDIEINYSDNPWLSEVLTPEREKMQREKPDEYAHVWLGKPRRALEGAIYADEIRLCEEQGRIGAYPYNPALPVDTGWDLGDSDLCAVWFIQRSMGQYRAIDYLEDRHKPLSYYLSAIEARGYRTGTDFFPHDASSRMLVGSFEETMRQRGRKVVVMPRQPKAAGVDAVRELFGTCWFNEKTTIDGLNRLRYFRQAMTRTIDPATGEPQMSMQPVHDDNSHGADAFRTIAMGYKRQPKAVPPPVIARRAPPSPATPWS